MNADLKANFPWQFLGHIIHDFAVAGLRVFLKDLKEGVRSVC